MKELSISKLRWKLFWLGLVKIPLIGFCRPKLRSINEDFINLEIPLRRRTKNHVGSMYLGVMSVGADLASGFFAYYHIERQGLKGSPVFGGMRSVYLKRAEGNVHFICRQSSVILEMIEVAKSSGERVTNSVKVVAQCNEEEVAHFEMDVSFRITSPISKHTVSS